MASLAWLTDDTLAGQREAAGYYRRALAILDKRAPSHAAVPKVLTDLGEALASQGKREEALTYYRRVLAIQEKRAPSSLEVAEALVLVGDHTPDQKTRTSLHRRALALYERLAPDSLETIQLRSTLADPEGHGFAAAVGNL